MKRIDLLGSEEILLWILDEELSPNLALKILNIKNAYIKCKEEVDLYTQSLKDTSLEENAKKVSEFLQQPIDFIHLIDWKDLSNEEGLKISPNQLDKLSIFIK